MLSLCMIVKNEESNLKSCLSKVAPFIDEIIIVDTGSTDSTKAIASEFTDKIYDFKWCNDFSKARNFCISKASYDVLGFKEKAVQCYRSCGDYEPALKRLKAELN